MENYYMGTFLSFRLLDLLFGTALVGFTALKYVLVTFFLLVDRSFCACGKIPELFKNYMRALKIYLCYIFPHNHTYSGITGNWNKLPGCLAFHTESVLHLALECVLQSKCSWSKHYFPLVQRHRLIIIVAEKLVLLLVTDVQVWAWWWGWTVYRGKENQSRKAEDKAPLKEQIKSITASECYLSWKKGKNVL